MKTMSQPPCFDILNIEGARNHSFKNFVAEVSLIFLSTAATVSSSAAAVDFTATVVIVVSYLAY